jgi:hypothetical protein
MYRSRPPIHGSSSARSGILAGNGVIPYDWNGGAVLWRASQQNTTDSARGQITQLYTRIKATAGSSSPLPMTQSQPWKAGGS